MIATYSALFARDSARLLALCSGLAWLSYGGYTLAIVLAVHAGTGSFAAAGAAVAAYSIGAGVASPVLGRLVDRGGVRILRYLAGGHLAASSLVLLGATGGGPPWVVLIGAAAAGATAPPVIATLRPMWPAVAGRDLAYAAHALNAVLADIAYIASPALTALLAYIASPPVAFAILVSGTVTSVFLVTLLAQWSPAQVGRRRRNDRGLGALRESVGLRTLAACDLAIGGWLGGLQVSVVAFAASVGSPELGALPLAASAAGSITVSLWVGSRLKRRNAAADRFVAGTVLVAVFLPFTLLAGSIFGLAAILVLVGIGYGLLGVAVFELLDDIVQPSRATEAFTWLTASQAAGAALGAALAGQVASEAFATAVLIQVGFAIGASAIALRRRTTLLPTG